MQQKENLQIFCFCEEIKNICKSKTSICGSSHGRSSDSSKIQTGSIQLFLSLRNYVLAEEPQKLGMIQRRLAWPLYNVEIECFWQIDILVGTHQVALQVAHYLLAIFYLLSFIIYNTLDVTTAFTSLAQSSLGPATVPYLVMTV